MLLIRYVKFYYASTLLSMGLEKNFHYTDDFLVLVEHGIIYKKQIIKY